MIGTRGQERMEAGSRRAAAPPAPLDSSPSSYNLGSAKRRRVSQNVVASRPAGRLHPIRGPL